MRTNEIKNELQVVKKNKKKKLKIAGWEKNKINNLKYETNKHIYGFQQFQTISPFGESIITSNLQ